MRPSIFACLLVLWGADREQEQARACLQGRFQLEQSRAVGRCSRSERSTRAE